MSDEIPSFDELYVELGSSKVGKSGDVVSEIEEWVSDIRKMKEELISSKLIPISCWLIDYRYTTKSGNALVFQAFTFINRDMRYDEFRSKVSLALKFTALAIQMSMRDLPKIDIPKVEPELVLFRDPITLVCGTTLIYVITNDLMVAVYLEGTGSAHFYILNPNSSKLVIDVLLAEINKSGILRDDVCRYFGRFREDTAYSECEVVL